MRAPQTGGPERAGRQISAFFPCFNDAGTIASMVMEALVVLRELGVEYEVLVIENGSTDYAWDVLDELERLYGERGVDPQDRGRVRIIRFGEPLGYGGALRAGFAALQVPPDLLYGRGRAVRHPRAARCCTRPWSGRSGPGARWTW